MGGCRAPTSCFGTARTLLYLFACQHWLCLSGASTGPKSAPEQPDISRSGRDFLEVCSSVDSEGGRDSEGTRDPARAYRHAPTWRDAPAWRDPTCLGW